MQISLRSLRHSLVALPLLVSAASAAPSVAKSGLSNAVVLVIRHGEKPAEGDQLAPAGVRRAQAYVGYFKRYKIDGRPLHLDAIFATADSKNSARERLTAAPLAKSLGLKLDQRYANKEYGELADDLRAHSYGHEILICWHHGHIPDLLEALGADPKRLLPGGKWPNSTFDWLVEIHYDANGRPIPGQTKVVHERLMPGDSQ